MSLIEKIKYLELSNFEKAKRLLAFKENIFRRGWFVKDRIAEFKELTGDFYEFNIHRKRGMDFDSIVGDKKSEKQIKSYYEKSDLYCNETFFMILDEKYNFGNFLVLIMILFEKEIFDPLEFYDFLDYGGGAGDSCILFSKFGFDSYYCDIGKIRNIAKKRFNYRNTDIGFGILDRKFGIVSCTEVLEHCVNYLEVLSDVIVKVKSEGFLVLSYSFSDLENNPMHLHIGREHGKKVLEFLKDNGFVRFVHHFKRQFKVFYCGDRFDYFFSKLSDIKGIENKAIY